jgi:hypothetical protein
MYEVQTAKVIRRLVWKMWAVLVLTLILFVKVMFL